MEGKYIQYMAVGEENGEERQSTGNGNVIVITSICTPCYKIQYFHFSTITFFMSIQGTSVIAGDGFPKHAQ